MGTMQLDPEPLVADRALSDQWLWALDQAERYGKQMAQLKGGDDPEIALGAEIGLHEAYSNFMWQFDYQSHHLLRQAYQSGFVTTWLAIQLEYQKTWPPFRSF